MIRKFCDYNWETRVQEPKARSRCKRRSNYWVEF